MQLAYGAHHDAITGSESDQVYLDLLTGWRDAWELGRAARDNALALHLQRRRRAGGGVEPVGAQAHRRRHGATGRARRVRACGCSTPTATSCRRSSSTAAGRSAGWPRDVPSLGWRAYRLAAGDAGCGLGAVGRATEIGNEHYRLRVDPARGGGVSLAGRTTGRELIADGQVGNELAVYDEYPAHPQAGEGPWHLLPKGPVVVSSGAGGVGAGLPRRRSGSGSSCAAGSASCCATRRRLTLWHGVARVDCRTTIDEFTGDDQLLRLRWPCPVPGAMPVSEVGDAVIGRGFGLLHEPGTDESVDTAKHPWTLDNPAYGWFGLSSAVRVRGSKRAAMRCVPCRSPRWSRRRRRSRRRWPAT